MAKVVKINKKKAKAAEDAMAPKEGRKPSSVRTVRVKSNKQLSAKTGSLAGKNVEAKTGSLAGKNVEAKTGSLATQVKAAPPVANAQLSANQLPAVGQLTATFAPNPNLSALGEAANVGEQNEMLDEVAKNANIYDQRIGGYGTATTGSNGKFKETGEQAVKRISAQKKVKIKKK